VDERKSSEDRLEWLVDTHLKPVYERFMPDARASADPNGDATLAHTYYAMVGAGSLIFAVAPECRRLTGLDPESPAVVEAHAEYVARLLIP